MTTKPSTHRRTLKDIEDMGKVLRSLVDEVQVQAHLGAMELKDDAGPYLEEVREAAKAATRDVLKRGQALRAHLKRLRAEHQNR